MSKTDNLHHIVFRTKFSRMTIPEESKRVILAYIYQVSLDMGVEVLRLNSYLNHVHIFVNLPPDINVAQYVQKVKGTSSHAFHGHPLFPNFEGWARRYASFSKSAQEKERIINYIKMQEEHHRVRSFREELEELFGKEFFKNSYNRRDWLDEATH